MDTPTFFYWGVIGLGVIGALVFQTLCWQLRRRHPSTWKDLGGPSLLVLKDRDIKPLLRFVEKRQFVALGDHRVSRLAWVIIADKWALVIFLLVGLTWLFWPWKT